MTPFACLRPLAVILAAASAWVSVSHRPAEDLTTVSLAAAGPSLHAFEALHSSSSLAKSSEASAETDQLLDSQNTSETAINATARFIPDPATLTAVGTALQAGLKIGGKVYDKLDAQTFVEFNSDEPVEVEVVPQGANAFTDMTEWKFLQVSRECHPIFFHRAYDSWVEPGLVWMRMDCRPTFWYHGKYKGKGKYLNNALLNCKLQANYGTSAKLSVKTMNPVNKGTLDEPVPQISVNLRIAYNLHLKSGTKDVQFTFGGDGSFHYSTWNDVWSLLAKSKMHSSSLLAKSSESSVEAKPSLNAVAATLSWTQKGADWAEQFFDGQPESVRPQAEEHLLPEQMDMFSQKKGSKVTSHDIEKGLHLGFLQKTQPSRDQGSALVSLNTAARAAVAEAPANRRITPEMRDQLKAFSQIAVQALANTEDTAAGREKKQKHVQSALAQAKELMTHLRSLAGVKDPEVDMRLERLESAVA